MPDSPDKDSQSDKSAEIDLSQLQGLSFGPDWSNTSSKVVARKARDKRESSGSGGATQRRDRRPAKGPRGEGREGGPRSGGGHRSDRREGGRRSAAQGGRRGDRRGAPAVFHPTVDALFYPEDLPFKALSQAIRRHCRTYELFEIAKLILEKSERYVVVIKRKGKQEEAKPFFVSIPDGAPFESEDEALNHVMKHHLETFFTVEETEVEPPKGSFSSVNKCGVTGELLGPPNYHRYQALLQEHHTTQLPNMPFARFESKIESIKDEEVIAEWVKKMTKVIRYTVKEVTGDEAPAFDTLESAKNYLLAHCKDRIVGMRDQARISGRLIDTLPEGPIKKSIETVLEMQRRFPLDTANNLRGRLRRMKFTIYKRGSKGVSFVCAVKRRFRDEKTVFAEDINTLIEFIEKHPNVSVKDLPKSYLGLETVEEHAVQPPVEHAPDMAAAEAVIGEEPSTDEANKSEAETEVQQPDAEPTADESNQEAKTNDSSATPAEAPAAPASTETAEPEPCAEAGNAAVPESTETAPDSADKVTVAEGTQSRVDFVSKDLPQEDQEKIRKMMMSLQWLVQEGYVTEFGDGSLFAPAPVVTSKPKEASVAEAADSTNVDAKTTGEDGVSDEAISTEEQKPSAEETAAVSIAEKAGAESVDASPESPAPETEPQVDLDTSDSSAEVKEAAPSSEAETERS